MTVTTRSHKLTNETWRRQAKKLIKLIRGGSLVLAPAKAHQDIQNDEHTNHLPHDNLEGRGRDFKRKQDQKGGQDVHPSGARPLWARYTRKVHPARSSQCSTAV